MASHRISASKLILAPAQQLYGLIADYHQGHPLIIPKPPFVDLVVEQGGVGAGTVMRVRMRVFGQTSTFHSVVTEPEPGRVLVETNDNGYITTFTVEPREAGQHGYVTISTAATVHNGILGAIEGWFLTRILYPTYVKELGQLAEVAAKTAV